jgi:hypothetical protein
MLVVLGLSFVYAFFISFIIQILTVHQFGALGMIGVIKALQKPSYVAFMADGNLELSSMAPCMVLSGLFLALPIIGTNALFERS